MEDDKLSYYVSHVVKSKNGTVKRKDGTVSTLFSLQVVTSHGEKKSVCWIDEGIRLYFNCVDSKDLKNVVSDILSYYQKFEFEILTLDKPYEENLSVVIISNFFLGDTDLQQKIDEYKTSE